MLKEPYLDNLSQSLHNLNISDLVDETFVTSSCSENFLKNQCSLRDNKADDDHFRALGRKALEIAKKSESNPKKFVMLFKARENIEAIIRQRYPYADVYISPYDLSNPWNTNFFFNYCISLSKTTDLKWNPKNEKWALRTIIKILKSAGFSGKFSKYINKNGIYILKHIPVNQLQSVPCRASTEINTSFSKETLSMPLQMSFLSNTLCEYYYRNSVYEKLSQCKFFRNGATVIKEWSEKSRLEKYFGIPISPCVFSKMWIDFVIQKGRVEKLSIAYDVKEGHTKSDESFEENHLEIKPSEDTRTSPQRRMGILLIEFFKFCMHKFQWRKRIVSAKNPRLSIKENIVRDTRLDLNQQDPSDETQDHVMISHDIQRYFDVLRFHKIHRKIKMTYRSIINDPVAQCTLFYSKTEKKNKYQKGDEKHIDSNPMIVSENQAKSMFLSHGWPISVPMHSLNVNL